MTGGRSTARVGWAAIAGVALGAALLAGARDPAPTVSATHVRTTTLVHLRTCPGAPSGCDVRRVTSR